MSKPDIEVRIAYPFDVETFVGIDDELKELVGRSSDWSGAGASWAGCGMRDHGYECRTFEEAKSISEKVKGRWPEWPVNIREVTSYDTKPGGEEVRDG